MSSNSRCRTLPGFKSLRGLKRLAFGSPFQKRPGFHPLVLHLVFEPLRKVREDDNFISTKKMFNFSKIESCVCKIASRSQRKRSEKRGCVKTKQSFRSQGAHTMQSFPRPQANSRAKEHPLHWPRVRRTGCQVLVHLVKNLCTHLHVRVQSADPKLKITCFLKAHCLKTLQI